MHSRTVQSRTAQALRQVSTLPHRESDGIFLLCFSGIYLFCGVGILRRYGNMIARNRLRRNWRISQFLTVFFGQRDKGEGPADWRALRSVSNNPLPPPFMGEVARWFRAKPGAIVTEGAWLFLWETGFFEYLQGKYSDSPRPTGTPLINPGARNGPSGITRRKLCTGR